MEKRNFATIEDFIEILPTFEKKALELHKKGVSISKIAAECTIQTVIFLYPHLTNSVGLPISYYNNLAERDFENETTFLFKLPEDDDHLRSAILAYFFSISAKDRLIDSYPATILRKNLEGIIEEIVNKK